jgi:multiple sugar transport system permease protein
MRRDLIGPAGWRRARTLGFWVGLGGLLAAFLFPFAWMVLTSLKLPRDVTAFPPVWLFPPTAANYQEVLTKTPFLRYLWNSIAIGVATTALSLALSLTAAYSIARYRQRRIALLVLIIRMIPSVVFGLPLFMLYKSLGLIDSHLGLVISHLTLVLPLSIWILVSFFEDVPRELEEAAAIDGSSHVGTFVRIVVPLCLPGISVAAILGFIQSWNNFVFVLILGGRNSTTLPMAVYSFLAFEDIQYGPLAAAAALTTLPIIVLALVLQRYLISGLSMGAVKG